MIPASWLPLVPGGKLTQPRDHLSADPCIIVQHCIPSESLALKSWQWYLGRGSLWILGLLLITGLTRALLPGNWIPLFPDFSSAPHDGDHLLLRLAQLCLVLALAPVERLREGAAREIEKLRQQCHKNFLEFVSMSQPATRRILGTCE